MDEDFKRFLAWADAAPEMPPDREMETIERFLIGQEEAYWRASARWVINYAKKYAVALRRMEQADDPVVTMCEGCEKRLTVFDIAQNRTLCGECRDDLEEGGFNFPPSPRGPTIAA